MERFGAPRLRPEWSTQAEKSQGLVEGRLGEAGVAVDRTGCGGSQTGNLHLPVTLQVVVYVWRVLS